MKVSLLSRALGIAAAGCILVPLVHAQQIQVNKTNRTLAITASDSASATADIATVHVGFLVYGADAHAAYEKASETSNAIAKALADAGVPKDAIQSQAQNLNPTPTFELEKLPPDEQAERRYQVQQSWTVKTKADDAAKILNDAVNAGANQSGQIDWSVTDENALEAKAAGKALARAHTIAAQMAQGLGIKLGELIYASNQAQENGPRPLFGLQGAAMPRMMKAPAPLAISPNKVTRYATVYAVFSIE